MSNWCGSTVCNISWKNRTVACIILHESETLKIVIRIKYISSPCWVYIFFFHIIRISKLWMIEVNKMVLRLNFNSLFALHSFFRIILFFKFSRVVIRYFQTTRISICFVGMYDDFWCYNIFWDLFGPQVIVLFLYAWQNQVLITDFKLFAYISLNGHDEWSTFNWKLS